jgi:2-succinyl-6-hydroxy-2,4-cyclohexadiene-1-carboxylate synthase
VLNFKVEGEGSTVVFLHGFLESIFMWDYLYLKKLQCKKVFIDLPGHGKSELNANFECPSLQFFVDEVLDVLSSLEINRFSVVGHSMGGYVALMLKQQVSGCDKVVLLNSNFWSDSDQKKKDRIRMADIAFKAKRILINESIPNLFGNPSEFKEEIERLKSEAMEMSSAAIAFASLAMRERSDFSDEINSNPQDYFIIHGVDDRLVSKEEMLSKTKIQTQVAFVPNTGHMSHIESAQSVSDIIMIIMNDC